MSELPSQLVELPDCSPLQRELFREAVRRGRPLPLVHVEPAIADLLRSANAQLEQLDDEQRTRLVDTWSDEELSQPMDRRWDLSTHSARLPPRWSAALDDLVQRDRAGVEVGDPGLARLVRSLAVRGANRVETQPLPAGLRSLVERDADQRGTWLIAIGTAMLTTARTSIGARRTARLMMAANEAERWASELVESADFEPSKDWLERCRELLVAFAEHPARERLRRMGLYVVAMASARELGPGKHGRRVDDLAPELWALMDSYADSIRRSSRRGLSLEAEAFLQAIEGDSNE